MYVYIYIYIYLLRDQGLEGESGGSQPLDQHRPVEQRGRWVGLYKIFVHSKVFLHQSIVLLLPPPTCIARAIAIRLHIYCAIYEAPPTPLLCAIHHTIMEMARSCNGQAVGWVRS